MSKQLSIIDEDLMEEFLSIVSIGLIECIKKGVIDPMRAEQWLFSPIIAYSSNLKKYSESFRYALDFASETYAASQCDNFDKSLNKNLELFFKIIEDRQQNNFDGRTFIEGLI